MKAILRVIIIEEIEKILKIVIFSDPHPPGQ
jgi:hypothetical protein